MIARFSGSACGSRISSFTGWAPAGRLIRKTWEAQYLYRQNRQWLLALGVERVSFVLTEELHVKRISFLDLERESRQEAESEDAHRGAIDDPRELGLCPGIS